MDKNQFSKNEQLFTYLISTFQSSAYIALGKKENPITKNIEINIEQASYYIDLLDMIKIKTDGNLTEYEEQILINIISELKLNLINENKKQAK